MTRPTLCPLIARLSLLTCLSLPALLTPTLALAQDDAKLQTMYTNAVDDYDMAMVEDAKGRLEKGLAYAQKNDLKGPVVAKIHVMLGIVKYAETQKSGPTEADFVTAIEMDPKATLPAVYETPALIKIFKAAKAKAKPPAVVTPDPVDPPVKPAEDPAQALVITHTAITKTAAGKPMLFEAFVSKSSPILSMTVYHRRFGEEGYQKLELRPADATRFAGEIPAEDVRTSQIEYYIDAADRGGSVVATVGNAESPISVVVLGSGTTTTTEPDNGGGEVIKPKDPTDYNKVFTIGLGAGSGFGLILGGQPTANPYKEPAPGSGLERAEVQPGFAPAFGHAQLDLGWIINESMRLQMFFKYQFAPVQDFNAPGFPEESKDGSFPSTRAECLGLGLPGDCLLGFKYKYFFSEEVDSFRPYSTVGLGIGRFRNWIQIPNEAFFKDAQGNDTNTLNPVCEGKEITTNSEGKRVCKINDTLRTGWAHFGLGAGFVAPISRTVEFYADSYLMFVTLDQGGIQMDLTLGFNFNF